MSSFLTHHVCTQPLIRSIKYKYKCKVKTLRHPDIFKNALSVQIFELFPYEQITYSQIGTHDNLAHFLYRTNNQNPSSGVIDLVVYIHFQIIICRTNWFFFSINLESQHVTEYRFVFKIESFSLKSTKFLFPVILLIIRGELRISEFYLVQFMFE